jgi:hypothetical protein
LIGCATIKGDNDGPDRGVMLAPLSYSGKKVVSIEQWNEAVNKQINYVKNLRGKGGGWAVAGGKRKATTGRLFGGDHVKKLPGVGKVTATDLAQIGITTVNGLLAITLDQKRQLANLTKLTKTKIDGLVQTACEACPNAAEQSTEQQQPQQPATEQQVQQPVNYHLADNPYEARYGDLWETIIKKAKYVRGLVCITKLITHIYTESQRQFNPTNDPEKDDWHFYHDTLSIMKSVEARAWMQSKGILKHWILPEAGLHVDEGLKFYQFMPTGNSPELMPLDNSLNKDLHEVVSRHRAATCHLRDGEDERKFSISTPERGVDAYFRALEGAPTSKRIVDDCYRFLDSLKAIHAVKGVMLGA